MKSEQIGGWQTFALLVLVRLVPVTIFFPLITETDKVQSAWVGALVGVVVAFGFVLPLSALGMRFPEQTIVQYAQTLLGRYVGKILGLVLAGLWLFIAASTYRGVAEAYMVALMPETPAVAFMASMAFLSANAARNGLEVFSRAGEIVLWIVLVSFMALLVLPYNLMRFDNLLPVFVGGLTPVIRTAGDSLAFFAGYTVLGMIIPHLSRPRLALRASAGAVLVSGVLYTLLALVLTAVFGSTASGLPLPAFNLNRVVNIANFIERSEVLSMLAWTVSSAVASSLFLWAVATGLGQVLGLKHSRHLVYPLAIIAVAMGLRSYDSFNDFHMFFAFQTWDVFAILFMVIVLAVLGIAAVLRGSPRPRKPRMGRP